MSIDKELFRRRMRHSQPLGKLIGLLAACLATLVGVATGHAPFVILTRALISGVAVSLLLSFVTNVIHVANMETPPKKQT